jgi:hypothetical protein
MFTAYILNSNFEYIFKTREDFSFYDECHTFDAYAVACGTSREANML